MPLLLLLLPLLLPPLLLLRLQCAMSLHACRKWSRRTAQQPPPRRLKTHRLPWCVLSLSLSRVGLCLSSSFSAALLLFIFILQVCLYVSVRLVMRLSNILSLPLIISRSHPIIFFSFVVLSFFLSFFPLFALAQSLRPCVPLSSLRSMGHYNSLCNACFNFAQHLKAEPCCSPGPIRLSTSLSL